MVERDRLRILGIETSTRRGTAALVEDGQEVVALGHTELGAHAETMLCLVDEALARAGWDRRSLDRIGVGVGPGSFTGIRVGISLAQGMALGLGVPLFGIESLEAMARAAPPALPGLRCPFLDARREELFVAAYDLQGAVRLAPLVVKRSEAIGRLTALCPEPRILLGEVVAELGSPRAFEHPMTDLPHATWVAILAGERNASDDRPVQPVYLREADAVLPDLAPNPLDGARDPTDRPG